MAYTTELDLVNHWKKVDEKVNDECLGDVDKVTPELIAKIVEQI